MWRRLTEWARALARDAHAVYLAAFDPRVPWYAKALALGVAAYAFSPIDLIPDFIPVVGLMDDLILVPLGVALVVKMIPAAVMAEHRARAAQAARPVSHAGAAAVIAIWVLAAAAAAAWAWRWVTPLRH
ncbi:MAG TPA: YkvA family protein [Xanthobacteraceae bacterium]|jgi:uncharacterized membrane protein YkvA (DUF1232 family)|nr:YkvA family protein [Xanthobacteraceae bacterium]